MRPPSVDAGAAALPLGPTAGSPRGDAGGPASQITPRGLAMPRRFVPVDLSVGERIRDRRELRRWSIRYAASRAGIHHTMWSRVERGLRRADRYLIVDIAAALECSTADLTGQPHTPADRALEAAHAAAPRVWRAVLEAAPYEPRSREVVPIAQLAQRVELLEARLRAGDYAATGTLLPDLVTDLHAAAAGPDATQGLVLGVRAGFVATFTLRYLGYDAEAAMAAERVRQSAEQLELPVPLALAEFVRALAAASSGSLRRCATLAVRAVDQLHHHLGEPTAMDVAGMLHLTSALALLRERPGQARDHVAAAADLARHTGETTSWNLAFGPTNVGIWSVGLEVDAGRPDEAVRVAQGVQPGRLQWPSREAAFHTDLARALTDVGRDAEAVRALAVAERVAPQLTRASVPARETARHLLHRAQRAAGGSTLRGLCERMGLAM